MTEENSAVYHVLLLVQMKSKDNYCFTTTYYFLRVYLLTTKQLGLVLFHMQAASTIFVV